MGRCVNNLRILSSFVVIYIESKEYFDTTGEALKNRLTDPHHTDAASKDVIYRIEIFSFKKMNSNVKIRHCRLHSRCVFT